MDDMTVARRRALLSRIAPLGREARAMHRLTQPLPRAHDRAAGPHPRRLGAVETWVPGVQRSVLALVVLPALLAGANTSAQVPDPQAARAEQRQNTAEKHVPEATSAQPPVSPASNGLAQRPPGQAKVTWDGRGLEIEASNSSLDQILRQVAAATGARLEGLAQDQRIFGKYGPGPGCDVLSKLLEGSGYNVLMVASHDTDAPLVISLSVRLPATPETTHRQNVNTPEQGEVGKPLEPDPRPDDVAVTPGTQKAQNPFGNGQPARDPLQFMDEILHRQQKIDQQTNPQQQ